MDEKIVLQSHHLYVRTWKWDDVETLHSVMSDPQTHMNCSRAEPWSRAATQSWLAWHIDHRIGWDIGTFNCPLILRENEQLIGSVGLNPYVKDERIPEIEWTISPAHWGKGYATEIGRAMLAYGFAEAGFPAIMGFALSHHQASRSVMAKIGMTYLRDKEEQGRTLSFYRKDCADRRQRPIVL